MLSFSVLWFAFYRNYRFDSIANATTEQEYSDRVQKLFACNEWISDTAVQTWFSKKWLPQCKVFLSTVVCVVLPNIVRNLQPASRCCLGK